MNEQASTSRAIPSTSNSVPLLCNAKSSNSTSSAAACSNSISSAAQNERNQKLLQIIYKYLQKQMNENQSLNAVQKESLEVVVHCLGYAFQFFEFDFVENNLEKIYEFFVKHKNEMGKENEEEQEETEVSPEDIVAADEFKEKGNKLMREEKFKEALDYYDKAVRLNPKEAALYCNRAAAYNNLNKFNEAIQDCNAAISLNGSYAKAYVRKGLAYEKLKDYKHAAKSYKKAHLLEPGNEHYKNLYSEVSKRLKPRQDESTSTPGTSFNMFLGPNMSSVPFVDNIPEFDNLMETIFSGVERQWQNGQNPPQNQQDRDDSSYNYFS